MLLWFYTFKYVYFLILFCLLPAANHTVLLSFISCINLVIVTPLVHFSSHYAEIVVMIFQFHTFLVFINNKKQIYGIAILLKLLIKLVSVTRNFINIELSEKFH